MTLGLGGQAGPVQAGPACSDSRLLKKSLASLEPQSSAFMAHYFATLFVHNPELRPMFPPTLGESRKWVFGALTGARGRSTSPKR
jgi:hypothetical protein